MLASIKEKIKGPVAYLVVGLITVPFALVGIGQFLTGEQNIVVASVDGDNINKNQYAQLLSRQKRSIQEKLGDNYTAEINTNLKNQVITALVNSKILENLAKDFGIVTLDGEIKAQILANKNFFEDGKFSLEKYKTILRLNGYSAATYESLILNEANNLQIKNNLLESGFLTDFDKKTLNDLINQERKIAYIVLKNNDFKNSLKISNTEIKNYFDENSTNFINHQKIKVDFVELSVDNLVKNVSVDEEKLQIFYEEIKEKYTSDETRRASHILLEDKDKALSVLAEIKAGGDFGALAKEHSIDLGSGTQGGDLGFFGKGVMVAAFEEEAFALKINDLSELVKSQFGYHIIKLTAIKSATVKAFSVVKDEVIAEYKQSEAQKQIFELGEIMQTLAYDGNLEDIADELNLEIETSDFFTITDSKYNRKFIQASFDATVIDRGENKVIEITSDKIVALRKNEFVPASSQTLLQATDTIRKILTSQKSAELAESKAKNIIANKSAKFSNNQWVDRGNSQLPAGVVNFAFTLSSPKDTIQYAYQVARDSVIVVKVSDIRIAEKDNNLELLLQDYNDEVFNDILQQLKRVADIKIFNKNL